MRRRDLGLPEWPDFLPRCHQRRPEGLDREARKLMLSLKRCEPCEGAGVACYSGSTVSHVGIVVMLDNQLQVAECNPCSGLRFCHYRDLSVALTAWSSGNDDKVLPVPATG